MQNSNELEQSLYKYIHSFELCYSLKQNKSTTLDTNV